MDNIFFSKNGHYRVFLNMRNLVQIRVIEQNKIFLPVNNTIKFPMTQIFVKDLFWRYLRDLAKNEISLRKLMKNFYVITCDLIQRSQRFCSVTVTVPYLGVLNLPTSLSVLSVKYSKDSYGRLRTVEDA
jgi:hypothetical protein